ncbi:AMP-binding protein [Lapillicoccus sp.]|uniref:AMP-binding protein n=1 Tax=Lapillicoccus sp. TaxID=1909287 RepID=UPI00326780D6
MQNLLTPLRFLERASAVHPTRTAIIDGPRTFSYAATAAEVTRLAHALRAKGLQPGDRVAYLAPNCAELLIAHFAVPLAGGVLVTINTRLSPEEVAGIVQHSGAAYLIGEGVLLEPARAELALVNTLLEVIALPAESGEAVDLAFSTRYQDLLAAGSDEPIAYTVLDEDAPISVNYTSGTTGEPKGVVYTHRGAYLNALGQVIHQGFVDGSCYLWTLPMFHCNGWCTTWALTAVSGTHVCLRATRADDIWHLIDHTGITHMAGAPTVLLMMRESTFAHPLRQSLTVTTAGAPPSPSIIEAFAELNVRVIHVYGLTETYGPYTVCEPQDAWRELPVAERARLMARQGVGMITADQARVIASYGESDELIDVPADGVTMGEIVMRGNTVMKEYFRDPEATEKAFRGGWFHSGDLGVRYLDGYIRLLDRAKDIIISGGENISTVEVEHALASHPAVADVAVIAVPDERWGERPKAFVVLTPGRSAEQAELIGHVKQHIAKFKAPKSVDFVLELPRTSTGKIRKDLLRQAEWAGHESGIQ